MFKALAEEESATAFCSELQERLEREVKGFDVRTEPCEFSPEDDPHPPLEWPERGVCCDGYGMLYSVDGQTTFSQRCPCWVKWKRRQALSEYLAQIPEGTMQRLQDAQKTKRWAWGKAIDSWGFQTKGVILVGESGTGKTIAGHKIIIDHILRNGRFGCYLESDMITSDLRAISLPLDDPERKEAVSRRYSYESKSKDSSVAFLLDDIGRSRETRAVIDTIRAIIRNLYNNSCPCVLTTNLPEIEISTTFGADIHRRLFRSPEWMTVVKV